MATLNNKIVSTCRKLCCLSKCRRSIWPPPFLLSWDIILERILESDWLRAFWPITWETEFKIENNELVKTDPETAAVLNNFFSNIVKNLDISRYSNDEPLVSINYNATLKAILKYKNHLNIMAIQNRCKDKDSFNFILVDQKQIEKEILRLDVNKASECSDIQ